MEQIYFSAALPGFIQAAWKEDGTYTDDTWPDDAVLLTDDEVKAFWKQTPPEGQQLGSINGRPLWIDLPLPTLAQYIEMAEHKKSRLLSDATSKIVIWQTKLLIGRDLSPSEAAQLNAWLNYIDAVTAIDPTVAPDISWPDMPAA